MSANTKSLQSEGNNGALTFQGEVFSVTSQKPYHLLFVSEAGEAQRQMDHRGGVQRTAGKKQWLQEMSKKHQLKAGQQCR